MPIRLESILNAHLPERDSPGVKRKRVAVAMANNPEVVGCIGRGIAASLAEFVLIGPAEDMRRTAGDAGVDISSAEIIEEANPVAASRLAAQMAGVGSVDVIMKGLVQTADFVRAVLDRAFGLLPAGALISHVAVADVAAHHKLLVITDAAITVQPTVDDKIELIRNAAQVARTIGVAVPKVACVAPVEKVSDKVPSTVAAALVTQRFSGATRPFDAVVDGPFGLDVAISAEAAAIKGIGGQVAGDADILLMPGIDAGNVLYKSISILAGGAVAGVVGGARVPIILTSRADSEESKYFSLLLALASAIVLPLKTRN
jgi:phosphate butyryltransferase